MNWSKLTRLYSYSKKGDSLFRAHQNEWVRTLGLRGKVLDLGSKSSSAKHLVHIQKNNAKITLTDAFPLDSGVRQMDANQPFPFKDCSYDSVLALNLLEHMYCWANVCDESHRVLKPGGVFFGIVPFLYQVHGDPEDFWRPTPSALERFLTQSGYENITITKLGVGIWNLRSQSLNGFQLFKKQRFVSWLLASAMDNLLFGIKRNDFSKKNSKFFLGLAFEAKKT